MLRLKKYFLLFITLLVMMFLFTGCNFIDSIMDMNQDGEENEIFDPTRHNSYVSFKVDGVLHIFHDHFKACIEDMSSIVTYNNNFNIDVYKYNTNERFILSMIWQGERAGEVENVIWRPTDDWGTAYEIKSDDFVVEMENFDLTTGLVTGTFTGHIYKDWTDKNSSINITEGFFYIKHEFNLPVVTIQNPRYGAAVSGQVTISGQATDESEIIDVNVSITENFGEENDIFDREYADGTNEWSFTFDSRNYTNGEYTISVFARDKHYNYSLVEEKTIVITN